MDVNNRQGQARELYVGIALTLGSGIGVALGAGIGAVFGKSATTANARMNRQSITVSRTKASMKSASFAESRGRPTRSLLRVAETNYLR